MFEELAEAIENLVVPAEAGALREVLGLYDRLGAKTTCALAQFDSDGTWELDGSTSMKAWMRIHLRMTDQQSARLLRTGRRLRDLPETSAAFLAGKLSAGQAQIIVDNVKTRHVDLFAGDEHILLPRLVDADVIDTFTAMRRWAIMADALDDGPEPPPDPPATAHLSQSLDGRGHLKGSFDETETEIIRRALDLAATDTRDDTGQLIPLSQRQGQAIVDLCRHYLDHQTDKLGKRHRPHLNITIGLPDLLNGGTGRTITGAPLSAAAIHALACDANIHRVITDGASSILDYGRATRTIPAPLFTSLVIRDVHCRFPGCDRKPEWCEGHHIWHWEAGGPTNLGNLVLLCSKHHHLIHKPGWHIRLDPTGVVEITQPDGTTRRSHPSQPQLAA